MPQRSRTHKTQKRDDRIRNNKIRRKRRDPTAEEYTKCAVITVASVIAFFAIIIYFASSG